MIGATFMRGRVDGETVEGGAPARVAGQFAAYDSCAIRNATADRLQIDAPADEASFAVVIYLDPDNANGGAGMPANGVALDWRLSADERYTVTYDKANTRWNLAAVHAATAQNVTLADSFSAGDAKVIYLAGDAAKLYVAKDGGVIGAGTARTQQPAGLPSTMDVGSIAATTQLEAAYGTVLVLDAPLTQAQWEALASLRATRPPLLGEGGTGAAMTVLWYGAHPVVWTLPASGDAIDFNDGTSITLRALGGIGAGPSSTRMQVPPLRDGGIYTDTVGAIRRLPAVLALRAADAAAMWTLRRQLAAAVHPRLGEGVLMFAPSTRIYETVAILDNPGAPMDESSAPLVLETRLAFICSTADWRDAVRNDDLTTTPAGGWEFPWEFPWEWTASAVDITVANDGDVPVYPIVVITAGATGCIGPSLLNATRGKTFAMRAGYEMAAGQVLVIDMDARTVELDGENAMGLRDPDTAMWTLAPGDNTISAGVASGSASVRIEHYPSLVGV